MQFLFYFLIPFFMTIYNWRFLSTDLPQFVHNQEIRD